MICDRQILFGRGFTVRLALRRATSVYAVVTVTLLCANASVAGEAAAPASAAFPSSSAAGPALFRVFGALVLVLGLFFAGLWIWRNWQRFAGVPGRKSKLAIVEAKSLGPRHTLYVVGYEEHRFLVAASPAGVSTLANLPAAAPEIQTELAPAAMAKPTFPFAALLRQALSHSQ